LDTNGAPSDSKKILREVFYSPELASLRIQPMLCFQVNHMARHNLVSTYSG